jgi:hypothetical protein
MTRSSILVLIVVGAFLYVIAGSGCAQGGVGDPCTPEQEYDVCFPGFDQQEVNVESKSFQCLTRLCLVNHFQGRVSCPYGQAASTETITSGQCAGQAGGNPTPLYPGMGVSTCSIPGGSTVLGKGSALTTDFEVQVAVPPQYKPRQTANAVYCSCRCENANGDTNDGAIYCACPSGFTCTQLVTSTGLADEGLVGGYCIKAGTEFVPSDQGVMNNCAPTPASSQCPLPE